MQATALASHSDRSTDAKAGGEHPYLIVRRSAFAELQARARRSPWREMRAAAIDDARTLTYSPAATIRARGVVLARIFSTAALAYIVDADHRRTYVDRIVDHIRHFAHGEPGSVLDAMRGNANKHDWNYATPTGNAFVQAVLALDVVHDDVPADELTRVEAILRDGPALYFAETKLAWRQGALAARAIWPLYERDVAAYAPTVAEWHDDVLLHLSADGVFTGGTGYADCRWTYQDREHKGLFGEVLAHAGVLPDWYDEPKVVAFQEWFNGYAFTPFRVCWPIGDSAPERHKPRYQQGPERAYRYGALAGRYASWLTEGQVPPAGLGSYVLTESFDHAPLAAPSRVFEDGGAWLKEASLDPKSLAAVLWNQRTDTDLHAHKETNAICLAAYGELLLRNAGYNGWNTPSNGFDWAYINDRAIAASTALFDYAVPKTAAEDRLPPEANDHVGRGGAGIVSSLLTGIVDVARGDSGVAIPNGRHLRDLIFVHPADGVGGYYLVVDDFTAPGCKTAHVVWHPNSDRYAVDADRQQYTWTSDEFAGRDVGLTICLATPPRDIAIREGALANWSHGKVGTYLIGNYALDQAGCGRVMTVLAPHDAMHAAPFVERRGQGATVRQGVVTDVLFTSEGAEAIDVSAGVSAVARTGFVRRVADGSPSIVWLSEATKFESESIAIEATSPVTLCWRSDAIHVSAAVPVTLRVRASGMREMDCLTESSAAIRGVAKLTLGTGESVVSLRRDPQ